MIKRLFDICIAALLVAICAPVIFCAAIGIWLSSPGPVLYRAQRVGRHGKIFDMLKLRTMHITAAEGSRITAPGDQRVFQFGRFIRNLKIDELPQFLNILCGDMSLVGPRAEDPLIVEQHYSEWMMETLHVAPGVTSPGAIYGYIMSETLLSPHEPEASYVEHMLQPKLALERAYLDRANLLSDIHYILLTARSIIGQVVGHPVALPSADIKAARHWAPQGPYPIVRI